MSEKVDIDKFLKAMLHNFLKFKTDIGLINKRKSLPFLNLCSYFFDKPYILQYRDWTSLLLAFAYILNKRIKNTEGIDRSYLIECKLRACKKALEIFLIASHQPDSACCRQLIWAAATFLLEWYPHFQNNAVSQEDKDTYKDCVKQLSRSVAIPNSKENVLHVICNWMTMPLAGDDHFTAIPNPKTLEIMVILGEADVNALDKDNNTPLDKLKMNFERRVNDGLIPISDVEKRNAINCAEILGHHNGGSSTPMEEFIENIRNSQ